MEQIVAVRIFTLKGKTVQIDVRGPGAWGPPPRDYDRVIHAYRDGTFEDNIPFGVK